jgi:glucokinase
MEIGMTTAGRFNRLVDVTKPPPRSARTGPALGIDVGGTKIAFGTLTTDGAPHEFPPLSTVRGDGEANLKSLRQIISIFGVETSTLGISVRTTLDKEGKLRDPANCLGWRGLRLGDSLSLGRFAATVIVPDVQCGAIAEAAKGAGQGIADFVYVTIGTGLSHCAVVDGVPVVGTNGAAFMSGCAVPCRCGQPDCDAATVEDICAGPGLAAALTRAGLPAEDARSVSEHVSQGVPAALETTEHAACHLGAYLSNLLQTFDPSLLIIGGGVGSGFTYYRERAMCYARRYTLMDHNQVTPIVPAALGASSAWMGAAYASRFHKEWSGRAR